LFVSTSAFTILPYGPVPFIFVNSKLLDLAMRLAKGVAKTLSLLRLLLLFSSFIDGFFSTVFIVSIIEMFKDDYEWFDFGTSTEKNGSYLNTGLIKSKEEFGLSAICYDTYKLVLQ